MKEEKVDGALSEAEVRALIEKVLAERRPVPTGPPPPSVGRIVHLHRRNQADNPLPAIITYVYGTEVSLVAFSAFGSSASAREVANAWTNVLHANPKADYWWEWPPRV